jgi:hypothetical protein
MNQQFRYRWPASALSQDEMRLLYLARESRPDHLPISKLIAEAVRAAYPKPQPPTEKETPDENSITS